MAVTLNDNAAQGSVCDVAGFEEHFIATEAERIANQPHAESLGLAVRLQQFGDTGQYGLISGTHR